MTDIKKVLDIQFNGQQSIKDLKTEIASLKKELDNCVAGSEEAAKVSANLEQKQLNLKAAMKGCVNEVGKLSKTYNGLSSQMSKLKAAQKDIDLSTKSGQKQYAAYAKEINNINDKLKSLDEQNGVFSRNVGNYANSIQQAFSGMGGMVGGVITSITTSLKLLVTNPWVAVLTLIVAALKELIDAFKRNSNAMAEMEKRGNKLKAVFVAIQRAFDTLIPKVVELTDKIGKLWDKIKGGKIAEYLSKGMKYIATLIEDFANSTIGKKLGLDRLYESLSNGLSAFAAQFSSDTKEAQAILNDITDRTKKLQEQEIKNATANAKDLAKIAELQAQIADKEGLTADERLKKLDEVRKIQKTINDREVKVLKEKLAILKLQHSLTQSNNDDLQEEAELEAQIISAIAKSNQDERAYLEQKKRIKKEGEKDTKEEYDALIQLAEGEKSVLQQRLNLAKDYSEEKYQIQSDLLNKEEELATLKAKKSITDEEQLQEKLLQIAEEYKLKREVLNNTQSTENTEKVNKQMENNASRESLNGSDSLQYYQAELDAARAYYASLKQLQTESNEDYESRQIAALQKIKNAEDNLNNQRLSNYTNLANGIAAIMSSVASAWKDSVQAQIDAGEISKEEGEKQFESIKALEISVATIQTISGAIAAFMGCQSLGQPWGLILGAVQAAAVTAAGMAQIAQISRTTLGSSSSGSAASATFALPSVDNYTPDYTQNLTGNNDVSDMQSAVKDAIEGADIKAYVVESDISNAQKRKSIRENESTW